MPWLVAGLLWAAIIDLTEIPDETGTLAALGAGLAVGTVCFLAWQIVALPLRYQFLASATGRSLQDVLEPVSPPEPRS